MPAAAAAIVIRSASLTGAQENPPTGATGTGRGAVVVNPTTLEITGGITFTGLTSTPPTAQHIHQAPSGNPTGNSTIPAIITLSAAADGSTYFIPAGTTLTAGQITALRAGELYFNVITAAQSAGEIRGQINLQGGVLAGVQGMDNGQEVGGCTGKTTTGHGTVIVDRATGKIKVSYMTHDVTTADKAHIHTSPTGPGSNGGVIINFTPPGAVVVVPNPAYQTVAESVMTSTNITDFLANYLYFNVHSTSDGCPGGEIRGNITALQ